MMKDQSWKRTLAGRFVDYHRELNLLAIDGDRHHRPFLRQPRPSKEDQRKQDQKPLDRSREHC
jgi:hypothetical protein